MTWPHPLTNPSTQPCTHPHPPMDGSVSTNDKSSNRIELSWFSQQFSNFYWFDLTPPINTPTHPPNYTTTHMWGSLHRFQIFKQNWNILISSSAIEFWMIPGVPPGGGGWVDGGGVVIGCTPPTCTHTCTCMHVHARTYDIIGNSQGIPAQWGWPFAWNYHVYHACMCMCVHACMCMHVYMCGGHLPTTPHPQELQEAENTKIQ